ncbi:MAG TPA: MAPEG family protein [Stellaceae bacterium]|nr:MAPEG family protein [Stellaceae bacterium]
MTPDLRLLLWSVALTFVEVVIAVLAASGQVGLGTLAGNRESQATLHGFAGRAQRAHRNMLESLPLFIALVLMAQVIGRANATTLLGCQLFFWGRLAHWLIYLAGIPWLRTLAWVVSVVGMVLIFAQLW